MLRLAARLVRAHSLALVTFVLAASLSLSGCYLSRDRSPGATADAAPIDAGRASLDARGAADTPVRPDVPPPRDVGPDCAAAVPEYDGPGCSSETRECLERCADEVECDECFLSDAECGRCVNTVIIACANRSGCGDLWVRYACCAARDPACVGVGAELIGCTFSCDAELSAYADCVNDGPAMECSAEIAPRCGAF